MTRPVLRLTLVGTSPLLMHSGSLLDPIHPIAVELAQYHGIARKSASDHRRISDLEFIGSLWQDDGRPCVPARTLQAALREAAKRRGAAANVSSQLFVDDDAPLDYDGPHRLDDLIGDADFRQRSSITIEGERRMCTRPVFRRWALTTGVAYEPALIERADVIDLMILAGDDIGIGAGRPRFGRFAVVPAAG